MQQRPLDRSSGSRSGKNRRAATSLMSMTSGAPARSDASNIPTDPTVYVAVGGFLAVVGFAAALVRALRAARLDPLTALRHE